MIAESVLGSKLSGGERSGGPQPKVILIIPGGIRHAESFSPEGVVNIPHLSRELLPQAVFYPQVRNLGVTAHFNSISSILTGQWQHVDDWGKLPPATPTLFEYFRKQTGAAQSETWVVASNKALTNLIGWSSDSAFGPGYGANVVFPKQLLIAAVENAIWQGKTNTMADRNKAQTEIESMLEGSNYEGLGWTVFDAANQLTPETRATIQAAIRKFISSGVPTTGDELTYFIAVEVMRKFAPTLLVVNFSDVEVAHFGSYALHLAGIQMMDRLVQQLWQEAQTNGEYRGRTSMFILPEFGRDPDGSSTNGFFNHRSNSGSCRTTWMMCLGAAVERPQIVERPIHHVDLLPVLSRLLAFYVPTAPGEMLPELKT
ncbi:MAG TPA: hypothetical protein VNG91_00370 [Terriglobia bacterium]|nr:hypothetical protein [Terriglobia bacterium]